MREVDADQNFFEGRQEEHLRPRDLEGFIGQKDVVENLNVMMESAVKRKAAMDHILLSGPPGLGKTTLAQIVARNMQGKIQIVAAPSVERKGDLAAVLTNLDDGDLLFIDEIHRLNIAVEEILYSAMEDFRLDLIVGQGPSARTMDIQLNRFTLIGATTRSGLLSHPLRDRFCTILNFDFYDNESLAKIVKRNSEKLGLQIEGQVLLSVAKRSRGTPRVANRILRRVRDFAVLENTKLVTSATAEKAFQIMKINEEGLDSMDLKILKTIKDFYNGGPVGIEALAATLGENRQTLESVYEPFLLSKGYIVRTPRGRMLGEVAQQKLTVQSSLREL